MTIPIDFIVLLLVIFAFALVVAAVVLWRRRRHVRRLQDLHTDHFRKHKKR